VNVLVGRDDDLQAVVALLVIHRFVTITGTVGVGKSALALAVAEHHRSFGARVVVVDVKSLRAVAASLAGVMHNDDALLVLDNLDALAGDPTTATLLRDVLGQHPRLRVLTTSRLRLRSGVEAVYRLSPLPRREAAAMLAHCCERLQVGAPWVHPQGAVSDDVGALVDTLGGLPLALALAAQAAPLLTPAQLLQRYTVDPAVLSNGDHDQHARHQSLSAAIDDAALCVDDNARHVWWASALWWGPFDVEELERLVAGSLKVDVLAATRTLLDASLLVRTPDGLLSCPKPLWQHARAALKTLPTSTHLALRRAHATFVNTCSEALPVLVRRAADLRAVIADAEANDNAAADLDDADTDDTVARAGLLLARLALRHAPVIEVPPIVQQALFRVRDDKLRMTLLLVGARAALHLGAFDDAQRALRAVEACAAANAIADDAGVMAEYHVITSLLARRRGDVEGAREALELGIATARTRQRHHEHAVSLARLAALTFEFDDVDAALGLFDAAIAACREHGDDELRAEVLTNAGLAQQADGRFYDADACFIEALALHRRFGHRRYEALTLADRGALAIEQGRPLAAVPLCRSAEQLLSTVGEYATATIARATARLAATWSGSAVLDSERALDHEHGLVGIGVDDGPAREHDIDAHLSLAAWVWNMAAHALADVVSGSSVADVAGELLRHHHRAENDVRTGRADEVRLALRVTSRLQRLLASNAVVVVDVDGQAIRVGDNESVVLRDLPAWAQIVWCLTTAAIDNAPVDAAALIAAGWPNEQLPDTVAAAALAEALGGLREAGLEQVLVVDDAGYRLAALVLVRSPTV
jgi:tetratricopeptide (TPR) repeat protein